MEDNECIEQFEHAGCTVRIYLDPDPSNPRKEYDNVGVMVCAHRKYDLGDVQCESGDEVQQHVIRALLPEERATAFEAWLEADPSDDIERVEGESTEAMYKRFAAAYDAKMDEWLAEAGQHGIVLPLYLYDHGGITIRTSGFSCPWDSGQVGLIYCTNAQIEKEWDGNRQQAEDYLKGEVSTYDDYLTGNVYGYEVKDNVYDFEDSCWGFVGDKEYCISEAKIAAECIAAERNFDLTGSVVA